MRHITLERRLEIGRFPLQAAEPFVCPLPMGTSLTQAKIRPMPDQMNLELTIEKLLKINNNNDNLRTSTAN